MARGTNGFWRQAFHHHDTASPETSETSALGYKQHARGSRLNPDPQQPPRQPTLIGSFSGQGRASRSMAVEFASLLPSREVVAVLVDNYFDKIHWFMLLFHQREFKSSLDNLYAGGHPASKIPGQQGDMTVGYIGVLLATCALSLRYVSPSQKARLADCDTDPESQRERILATLRLRLLDVLALGSLEAVQICVLLGSYYLYHGEPELAWPLCGCALRLAQALELHRRPILCTRTPAPRTSQSQRSIEARKRCWWAVHEIETFCSMIYGFPLSISDADCDAAPLDPSDPWSISADGQSSLSDQPNLLIYKCCMSKLSKIVKSAIQDLYGSRQDLNGQANGRPPANDISTQIQAIVKKVASLDAQLSRWYSQLPAKLRVGKLTVPSLGKRDKHRNHGNEKYKQASTFDEQLFQLQALALKLAFENARILVHRPLLSYKVFFASASSRDVGNSRRTPNLASIDVCRDAALQISCAGNTPIFREASTTYALNFIALHILTAGATLCIMASLSPLSPESLESKLGVRRLMEMQASLKQESLVASQGLEILRKLSFLVMKKETNTMLGFEAGENDLNPMGTNSRVDESASNRRVPEGSNMRPTENNPPVSTTSFGPATQAYDQETHFLGDPVDMEISEFHEDLLMAQTMSDVEQGLDSPGYPLAARTMLTRTKLWAIQGTGA